MVNSTRIVTLGEAAFTLFKRSFMWQCCHCRDMGAKTRSHTLTLPKTAGKQATRCFRTIWKNHKSRGSADISAGAQGASMVCIACAANCCGAARWVRAVGDTQLHAAWL